MYLKLIKPNMFSFFLFQKKRAEKQCQTAPNAAESDRNNVISIHGRRRGYHNIGELRSGLEVCHKVCLSQPQSVLEHKGESRTVT